MNLSDYSNDSQKEGFCLLHSGTKGKTIIGVSGKRINEKCKMQNEKYLIGYFAYPNPTLKNDIPDERFYVFEDVVVCRDARSRVSTNNVSKYRSSDPLQQSVTKSQYIKKIKQIKELLSAGEIYQMCYAIRFRKKFIGDSYVLFLRLSESNPADFSAYLNCGDYQIISSSPERLFKVQDGTIITQPIKGTAPKGAHYKITKLQDYKIKDPNLHQLLNSEKERAELDMITDLERNDVGKICKYGTLRLTKEREVMELPNIWHTYLLGN